MLKAIRNLYAKLGVKGYYEQHSKDYKNPHYLEIKKLLTKNLNQIDTKNVLDLSCGNGEVTEVLAHLGVKNIEGTDPYTCDNYKQNTGKQCRPFSFKDILRGKLTKKYSAIICSFALHLADEKDLFSLTKTFLQHSKQLVIITPHKRPDLSKYATLNREDFVLTNKGKKVRLRIYSI